MAFEPKRSIAGIMMSQQWRNPVGMGLRGYMAGQENSRRNQETDLRQRAYQRQDDMLAQQMAKNEAMRPFMSKALGIQEQQLPPNWTLEDTSGMRKIMTEMDEAQQAKVMETGNAMAATAVNYLQNDHNGESYPAFKAQMD